MTVNYSAPAGRLLLKVDAPRSEWLDARRTGVGGTDVATLMGSNKFQTPFEAWQDKFSERSEDESTEAMWWGQNTEALTAIRFEERTGLKTRKAGMYHHREYRHHLANPDRFTEDGGVLEIKDHESLSDAGKTVLKGEITDHAFDQLMWYLHVTGRTHGWFAAKVGKQTQILGPFPRNEAHIAHLVAAADTFWEQVTTNTVPPMDLATVTAAELAFRFPAASPEAIVAVEDLPVPDIVLDDLARLAELKAGSVEIDGEKSRIEARLKATVGDREYLTVHGRPVLRWQQVAGRKTFDKSAAVRSLAERLGKTPVEVEHEFTKQGAPTRRLTLIEEKASA